MRLERRRSTSVLIAIELVLHVKVKISAPIARASKTMMLTKKQILTQETKGKSAYLVHRTSSILSKKNRNAMCHVHQDTTKRQFQDGAKYQVNVSNARSLASNAESATHKTLGIRNRMLLSLIHI